ncbi:MAG TPA: NAD(P)H-hydrate dehydratase [Deltaproteobacteria bacterium]|nr:NAD(P)H-hydrate dehydratase [Deltaproteobacteria bacterium]HOI07554.1 NAD(P)H-hydrate dehydratase [Deltaproteobacteria bacterium]
MKVSSVEEMRAMDAAASERYGIEELLLMENAGLAACTVLDREVGIRGSTFVILCGPGNNGGDGFVVARKILSSGGTPKVFILGERDKYRNAARKNLEILGRLPIEVTDLDSIQGLRHELIHADAVVDALLGTGLQREVTGLFADVIREVNGCPRTVLSLDIPSGINGNTGCVMGCAVQADFTVTFGLPKIGNLLPPGSHLGGRLFVTHISFPPALTGCEEILLEVNIPPALPVRDPAGYKGTFGEALFVAGARGYFGAPSFSAMSFLKAGGGYSRLACPEGIMPFVGTIASEIVFLPQKETSQGSISYENLDALLDLAGKMDITVIGPGLSLNEETAQLVRELTAGTDKPVILDADGIAALAKDLDIIRRRTSPTVLTPHMGEMSRITGLQKDRIEADRIGVLRRWASDLGAVIVLKGASTLIGFPDGRVRINTSGNSGMGTAGSGDALTGTIAAMYGLGLPIDDAVCKGVFLHGVAGDLAAEAVGQDGMTARDILEALPGALQMDRDGLLGERYPGIEIV